MSNWFKGFTAEIDERQSYLNQGIPTLIPFSNFPRFSKIIPGVIPGDNVLITAETGGMKSRLTRSWFIKNIIEYGNKHGIEVKIYLNSLEEPINKLVTSFVSTEMFRNYGIETNFYEINNYGTKPMTKDFRLKLQKCKDKIDKLQENLKIYQIANPYGFYVEILKDLFKTGKFYKNNVQNKSWKSVKEDANTWDQYVPNNPKRLVIAIFDTLDAAMAIKGKSQYETILSYAKFFSRTLLGIRCGVINVWVQQQSPDLERVQTNIAGKTIIDKVKPGLDTLLVCRAVSQAATLAFGIFDPVKYGETAYGGYDDIRQFKGIYRSLILLKGREGARRKGTEIPIVAFPARDEFFELPEPNSPKLKTFLK